MTGFAMLAGVAIALAALAVHIARRHAAPFRARAHRLASLLWIAGVALAIPLAFADGAISPGIVLACIVVAAFDGVALTMATYRRRAQ